MGKRITIRSLVVGFNSLQHKGKIVNCWTNASDSPEARQPLNLSQHESEVVEVGGTLHTDLWDAQFIRKFDKPKEAKSLKDLMQIREDNRETITKSKNLGSALGLKWALKKNTKRPCIIVFVEKKLSPGEVNEDELIPEVLEDKNGTWCLTDVVVGGESIKTGAELLPELSPENKKVVEALSSKGNELIGGIRLAFKTARGKEAFGTAGIAVKTGDGHTGFLTNQHVAGSKVRKIYHPHITDAPIGSTHDPGKYSVRYAEFEKWYGIKTSDSNAQVKCDYGFIKIDKDVQPGIYGIGKVGPLKSVDLDTMDIIGQKIISVGAVRGIQRGTIAAYSYEWIPFDSSVYTDFLILDEEGDDFSSHGDSGKLIVTDDDEHRPIALHWGGSKGSLSSDEGEGQKFFGKAIELGKILDMSGLSILD